MTLFLTGATGFIGAHVLQAAVAAGHEVVGLRRAGAQPRIPQPAGVVWKETPWADLSAEDFSGVDAVIHCSAQGVSPQPVTWADAFRHNVLDQMVLLERARAGGVTRFVIGGSCLEYGDAAGRHEAIPADAALEPRGPYASSKAAGCVAALAWARSEAVRLAYLRVFHAFGEGQHEANFWPSLRRAALAGENFPMTAGDQLRDFVPVEAVAAEFLRSAVEGDLKPGQPVIRNVGTGKPQTIRQFAEHWWEVWGAKGKLLPGAVAYRPHEVMRYVPLLEPEP